MLARRWNFVPALAILAIVPLAALHGTTAHKSVAVAVAAKPVTIGVRVLTAMHPLDLQKVSAVDFGDTDAAQ